MSVNFANECGLKALEATCHLSASNQLTEVFNPLTPMSDQERISPHQINTISNRKVKRIKKNIS